MFHAHRTAKDIRMKVKEHSIKKIPKKTPNKSYENGLLQIEYTYLKEEMQRGEVEKSLSTSNLVRETNSRVATCSYL